MGTINEKTVTRPEEKGSNFNADPRRGRNARSESEGYGTKQERDDRAHSETASIFTTGTSITGGMLRQLIADYRDQLAAKKDEINKLQDEIRRANEEAEKTQSRIEEFEALQTQLENQVEELD